MYDYLIKNGLVVDGSGKPAVKADVAVKGDKVARIAPDIQEPAAEVYDAAGKYVIPALSTPTFTRNGIALTMGAMSPISVRA